MSAQTSSTLAGHGLAAPDSAPFAARRARVCAALAPGAVAVLGTAPEAMRNADSDYPYRHDSYFYYLTGFSEPEAWLVLVAGSDSTPAQAILFCREKNAEREIWDGYRWGPEAAAPAFGMDQAFPAGELDAHMARVLANAPALHYAIGRSEGLDGRVRGWLEAVRRQGRTGVTAPASTHDLLLLLDEMRLFKDETERSTMRRAASISAQAHIAAMQAARPGVFEYELEAELVYAFRKRGAQAPAYNSIVAGGANACVLHYNSNNARIADGALVLIDAGCELDSYASDITRTFPVNGRFSEPQRQLYELVLAAQGAALAQARPGQRFADIHDAATRVLVQGMLDLGLLDKATYASPEAAIEARAHTRFYMHGTSHWLGLDVHDVGAYRDVSLADRPSRPLQPGMVLTVEPGIYVRPADDIPEAFWNVGIRIEDDVFITEDGHEILSIDAPKSVADIEALMASAEGAPR